MKNTQTIEQAIRLYMLLTGAGMSTNAYKCANLYTELLKISRALSNIDVQLCNGDIDDDTHSTRGIRLFNRIEKVVLRWLNDWEHQGTLYHYHQTDPRGCSLYVSTKPIDSNTYNTSALAIY